MAHIYIYLNITEPYHVCLLLIELSLVAFNARLVFLSVLGIQFFYFKLHLLQLEIFLKEQKIMDIRQKRKQSVFNKIRYYYTIDRN